MGRASQNTTTCLRTQGVRCVIGLRIAAVAGLNCIILCLVQAGRICLVVGRGCVCVADAMTRFTIKGFRVTRTCRAARYLQQRSKRTDLSMSRSWRRSSTARHCPTINARYPMRSWPID